MKIKISKISSGCFKSFIFSIGKHFGLGCVFVLILSLIFGCFLYYKFSYYREKNSLSSETMFPFNESMYKKALRFWEEDEKRFNEADSKEYIDPFRIPVISLEEESENAKSEEEKGEK